MQLPTVLIALILEYKKDFEECEKRVALAKRLYMLGRFHYITTTGLAYYIPLHNREPH